MTHQPAPHSGSERVEPASAPGASGVTVPTAAEPSRELALQARMAELLAVEVDYSGDDTGIGLVWELPVKE